MEASKRLMVKEMRNERDTEVAGINCDWKQSKTDGTEQRAEEQQRQRGDGLQKHVVGWPEIAGANVPERWRGWRLRRRPRDLYSGERKDAKVAATVSALAGRSVLISLVPSVAEADVATVDGLESMTKSARDRKRCKFTVV
ncbi:hypothetical protein BHM03_00006807 [Ensete ventricosum]|nr:hypothetical protein BHM03_00006807 [Ensete ventricosum]